MLPSLEIAGPGGHWVEVSRAIAAGEPSEHTRRMMEAYEEYFEEARRALRPGASAHDVHRAVSRGFVERGYRLGHVTGHSIGMTMIEFPKIGEGVETELEANMVFSMHPHAIAENGRECLYMQDTWLVTARRRRPAGRPADAHLPRGRLAPLARVAAPAGSVAQFSACYGAGRLARPQPRLPGTRVGLRSWEGAHGGTGRSPQDASGAKLDLPGAVAQERHPLAGLRHAGDGDVVAADHEVEVRDAAVDALDGRPRPTVSR